MEAIARDTELRNTAAGIAGRLAQAHAALVELASQLIDESAWAGDGIKSPEHWLQIFAGLSPSHAREVTRVARRTADLPEAVALMEDGRLSLDQAAVVARYVPAEFSESVAFLAEQTTVTQLSRVLSRYEFTGRSDVLGATIDSPSGLDPWTEAAKLSMTSAHGRFTLRYTTNAVDGALVEQAIREAKDALFCAGQTDTTLADGLLEVANRSLGDVAPTPRLDKYRIVVHLDTDGAWIGKRCALPRHHLDRVTCDGRLLPVWETEGVPVSVGRSRRIVPEHTRRLIEDRDQGCRYPGYQATGFLENHHITHWADGGSTNVDSLMSLCSYHHREHHNGSFDVAGNPNVPDGLRFTGRRGYRLAPTLAPRPPDPPPEPPDWHGPRGEPLNSAEVCFHPGPRRHLDLPGAYPPLRRKALEEPCMI